MIVTITGPSGVGKTTLYNNLLHALPDLSPLVSVTTRAPRPTDEKAFEYVSDEEFDRLEKEGVFVWTVHPHGKKYGTKKSTIEGACTENAIAILVIAAVQKLRAFAPSRVTSLYIHIDDEVELRKRFTERADMTAEEIESRIIECRSWNKEAKESGIPFIYLDGKKSREELVADALAALQIAN